MLRLFSLGSVLSHGVCSLVGVSGMRKGDRGSNDMGVGGRTAVESWWYTGLDCIAGARDVET